MTDPPVQIRGGGFGLDVELAQRAAEKYDPTAEAQAQEWIEAVLGEKLPTNFADSLKSGYVLCKFVSSTLLLIDSAFLVDRIQPGLVPRPSESSMPFKQMENVSAFIRACRQLGVAEFELFETVDLYEKKDIGIVVTCLHALGRAVQKNLPDYKGPQLQSTKRPSLNPSGRNSPNGSVSSISTPPAEAPKDTEGKEESSSRRGSGESVNLEDKLIMQEEAQCWIEDILGEKFTAPFGEYLKSGVVLCRLFNAIQPGTITRIESSWMPFKQMENITAFLKACREFGVPEHDLFETVDLFEMKDLTIVVRCLHAFGRTIQKKLPDRPGPHLGVRETEKNRREFTEKQLREAAAAVSRLNMGSHGVMERLPIDRSTDVHFGAAAAGPSRSPNKDISLHHLGSYNKMERPVIDYTNSPIFRYEASAGKLGSPNPAAWTNRQSPGPGGPSAGSPGRPQNDHGQTVVTPPSHVNSWSGEPQASETKGSPIKARGGGFGLDAELAQKALARYDFDLEAQVQKWIEEVTEERFPASFGDSLADGVLLCKLLNKIQPGTISNIHQSRMPFKQMENISMFLKAIRKLNVAEYEVFETVDLYEQKDLGQVVRCLISLAREIKKTVPSFTGPHLAVGPA